MLQGYASTDLWGLRWLSRRRRTDQIWILEKMSLLRIWIQLFSQPIHPPYSQWRLSPEHSQMPMEFQLPAGYGK